MGGVAISREQFDQANSQLAEELKSEGRSPEVLVVAWAYAELLSRKLFGEHPE